MCSKLAQCDCECVNVRVQIRSRLAESTCKRVEKW